MVKSEALVFLVEIFFRMVIKRVRIERTFNFNERKLLIPPIVIMVVVIIIIIIIIIIMIIIIIIIMIITLFKSQWS